MHMLRQSKAAAAGLLLLLGCSSPEPEPASAEAVERAVTEAERRLEAIQGASGEGADEAEAVQAKGATT